MDSDGCVDPLPNGAVPAFAGTAVAAPTTARTLTVAMVSRRHAA
jgi:hypothetical protein